MFLFLVALAATTNTIIHVVVAIIMLLPFLFITFVKPMPDSNWVDYVIVFFFGDTLLIIVIGMVILKLKE